MLQILQTKTLRVRTNDIITKWINKFIIDTAINIALEDRFDSRVSQIKQLFGATVNLIVVLKTLINKHETITQEAIDDLQKFNQKIGNEHKTKQKKRIKIQIKFQ